MLLAGAGAAATVAIPNVAVAAAKRVAPRSHLDRSTWEPLVGTILETRNPGMPRVPLLLEKIEDTSTSYGRTAKYQERSFILVFRGPAGQPLADSTHRLAVPGVGKVDIWFASSSPRDDGWSYVAVFSNSRVRQRPPRKPKASPSHRAQARQRSRKSERAARRRRRENRRRERERERAEERARESAVRSGKRA